MSVDISPVLWFAVIAGNAAIAVALGLRLRDRPAAVAAIGAWLVTDLALGVTGIFEANANRRFPTIAIGLVTPIVVGIGLLVRAGPVRSMVDRIPLPWLIAVQVYRVLGAVFLVGWAHGDLPAAFALPAGLGDVAIGVAAPFVAWGLARRPERSRGIATIWNLAGLVDLVIAVTMGVLTSPGPLQVLSVNDPNLAISRLPFVLVPLFAVPVSVLLHGAALRRLAPPAQRMQGPVSAEPSLGAARTARTSVPFKA